MSWETESDREWERQYYGCSCRGDPRVVNCPECDEEYCARCTEHKCAVEEEETK